MKVQEPGGVWREWYPLAPYFAIGHLPNMLGAVDLVPKLDDGPSEIRDVDVITPQ